MIFSSPPASSSILSTPTGRTFITAPGMIGLARAAVSGSPPTREAAEVQLAAWLSPAPPAQSRRPMLLGGAGLARLAVGGGLNVVFSQVNTVRARDAGATDDLVTGSGSILEGRSLFDVSGIELAFAAGLVWQPTSKLWIGVSYQSQPGVGEMSLEGTVVNRFGLTAPSTTQEKPLMFASSPTTWTFGGDV